MSQKPKVAVVGAGWWSQGWHLPQLDANPNVDLVAIVDREEQMKPELDSLTTLCEKYHCRKYYSVQDMLEKEGDDLDGVLVATPHATHYELGSCILKAQKKIHILMEKPMTTVLSDAQNMYHAVKQYPHSFLVNHTANYRLQAKQAREILQSGEIGKIRHVSAFFASPLKSLFEDKSRTEWNEPSEGMLGNGFTYGQMTHLVAWIFHVCSDLEPKRVSCNMTHCPQTGADIAVSASVACESDAVLSISGTSLLPGDAHSDPPVGKRVRLEIYGDRGALFYSGVDTDPSSGKLEIVDSTGNFSTKNERFDFENTETKGIGPESLQNWIKACQGDTDYYVGADCELGMKAVAVVAAMYESNHSEQPVQIDLED